MNIGERFGANLKRQRKLADISQEEVAVRASMHLTTVSLIERGIRLPRADSIARLAGALEVDTGTLFEGIEWQPGSVRQGNFKSTQATTTRDENGFNGPLNAGSSDRGMG